MKTESLPFWTPVGTVTTAESASTWEGATRAETPGNNTIKPGVKPVPLTVSSLPAVTVFVESEVIVGTICNGSVEDSEPPSGMIETPPVTAICGTAALPFLPTLMLVSGEVTRFPL